MKTHNSVLKSVASEAFLANLPAQETFSGIPHLRRGSRSLLTWGKAGINKCNTSVHPIKPKISEKAGWLWGWVVMEDFREEGRMSRDVKVELYPVRGVGGETCQPRNTKTRGPETDRQGMSQGHGIVLSHFTRDCIM